MATEESGGQGPLRENGEFEVLYTATTPKRGRHDRKRRFTQYSKAKAFYDKVDDSAAIWDVTRYAELCDAKARVAYYRCTLQTIKPPTEYRSVVLKASDEEGTQVHIAHQLKRRGWKLVPNSVQELSETEFRAAEANESLKGFVATLPEVKARSVKTKAAGQNS